MPRRVLPFVAMIFMANSVHAQSIDIVLDPGDPVCSADVGANPWIELHVIAVLGDEVTGLHGAQFKVAGLPETWNEENVSWAWDASVTLAFGNPLFAATDAWDDRGPGAAAAWSQCRPDQGTTQRIGKILLYGAPTGDQVTLSIQPFQLNFQEPFCVLMNRCDDPVFSKVCVQGGTFVLNGTNSRFCNITAVEDVTWTAVKGLYQ